MKAWCWYFDLHRRSVERAYCIWPDAVVRRGGEPRFVFPINIDYGIRMQVQVRSDAVNKHWSIKHCTVRLEYSLRKLMR